MRKKIAFIICLTIMLLIGGCSTNTSVSQLKSVGLLLEDTIDDKGWNFKGYQGLLKIHNDLNVDVYFNEEINSLSKVQAAVEELAEKDVNLIFGHGKLFANFFNEISKDYPNIHFVSFNGEVSGENVTSLHFNSHAMGFFAGMVAGKMTQSDKVGIIAAFSWQPEIEGFIQGAQYQNNKIDVAVDYVNDWGDVETALTLLDNMKSTGIDVYYPTGDGFHISIIEEVKNNGDFAIGFVSDQSDIGGSTVLTSTVQHVDHLYQVVAERFSRGELVAGNMYYDFADGVITLGEFSSVVPEEFELEIREAIEQYINSGKLPQDQ